MSNGTFNFNNRYIHVFHKHEKHECTSENFVYHIARE